MMVCLGDRIFNILYGLHAAESYNILGHDVTCDNLLASQGNTVRENWHLLRSGCAEVKAAGEYLSHSVCDQDRKGKGNEEIYAIGGFH